MSNLRVFQALFQALLTRHPPPAPQHETAHAVLPHCALLSGDSTKEERMSSEWFAALNRGSPHPPWCKATLPFRASEIHIFNRAFQISSRPPQHCDTFGCRQGLSISHSLDCSFAPITICQKGPHIKAFRCRGNAEPIDG